MNIAKRFFPVMAILAVMGSSLLPLTADARCDNRYRNAYYRNDGRFYRGYANYERHPYLKKAAIGGGAGAIIGGVLGSDGSRVDTALKGALIGAGAGMGYEYLRRRDAFRDWRW